MPNFNQINGILQDTKKVAKNCPFCGAEVGKYSEDFYIVYHDVDCFLHSGDYSKLPIYRIDRWDTRKESK